MHHGMCHSTLVISVGQLTSLEVVAGFVCLLLLDVGRRLLPPVVGPPSYPPDARQHQR